MAKLRGFGTSLKGSAGDWTFVETAGGTIAKQKVPAHNKSHTYPQMRRRVQLRNIQNLWAAFIGWLHPMFEGRAPNISDANAFMSANLGIVPVYLTKEEAAARASVVAPYQVSRGSLPEIHHATGSGGEPVTDIALGGLAIGPATTVKAFSDAVCLNNVGYEDGDKIICFRCTQTTHPDSGFPYARIVAEEAVLDRSDDETLLYDRCSAMCFATVDGKVGAQTAASGGICWIHSRLENDILRVSTQRLECDNPLLPRYQSTAQLDAAIESYGGASPPQ